MQPSAPDVVIVGGGIAGLSALARCAERGVRGLLLEREPWLAGHASGRNAAIYRPLEDDASTVELSQQSLAWLEQVLGLSALDAVGLVLAAGDARALEPLVERARHAGLQHELLCDEALFERAPALCSGSACTGLHLAGAGVLDNHAMLTALERYARARGAAIRTGATVSAIRVAHGRILGVTLASGEQLDCGALVLAVGAWSAGLARALGSRVRLQPIRRHLVQLKAEVLARAHPVVWRIDGAEEVYFRAESGGVLASPCDALPMDVEAHAATSSSAYDVEAGELLARKLASTAPALVSARVQRAWTCLRTFAPDRELVVGADPAVNGLYWLAGLGGRGMGVAVAAGEHLARAVTREAPSSLADALSPARFK